jgi:hypothetical protein
MLDPQQYGSPAAFRAALEQKIRTESKAASVSADDLKRQICFDRFLARLDFERYTVVGGYSLEIRFPDLKRTRDIDMALTDALIASSDPKHIPDRLEADLRRYTQEDLNDNFSFVIESAHTLAGPPEGGHRYHFTAMLAGREYHKFHVDLRVQSVHILPPEMAKAPNKLGFSDAENKQIALAQREEIFADKLEAYTKPRLNANSRVRDLIDMNVLISSGLDDRKIKQAVSTIFKQHGRSVPDKLDPPPEQWQRQFTMITESRNLHLPQAGRPHALAFYHRL